MKNSINYYYNIRIDDFIKSNTDYYFFIDSEEYHLIRYDRPIEDIGALYKLNIEMLERKCLVHKIILNKDNRAITMINNEPYILLKLNGYRSDRTRLNEINYLQNMTYNIKYSDVLLRDNWVKLWCDKIDYYEYQINQLGKEYPILCDSLSYYIGLGENAISYLINNIKENNKLLVVSHKRIRINDGSFEFYNPINFIIDNRVRDISEYIKNSFFNNEFNSNELKLYLNHNNFSKDEYTYLFSRLLFPTYYFDVYDKIINVKDDENKIIPILEKAYQYEEFLYNFYKYVVYEKKVQIEPIEWILKNHS